MIQLPADFDGSQIHFAGGVRVIVAAVGFYPLPGGDAPFSGIQKKIIEVVSPVQLS